MKHLYGYGIITKEGAPHEDFQDRVDFWPNDTQSKRTADEVCENLNAEPFPQDCRVVELFWEDSE